LIEACTDIAVGSIAPGYINDIAIIVLGEDQHENVAKLELLHARIMEWAYKHASIFDPKKY